MTVIEQIIETAKRVQADCQALLTAAEPLQKKWLSTAEFARLKGLTAKTVCNYANAGMYKRIKQQKGRWFIHISELER